MKIPKKLRLFGQDFTVSRKKLKDGGAFSLDKRTMQIPTKQSEYYLMHELLEAVMTEHDFRFYPGNQGAEYLFVMNHSQMDLVARTLIQIILDNRLDFNHKEHAQKISKKNTKKRTKKSRSSSTRPNKKRKKTK